MDPFEKYDMTFNGAVSTRMPTTSPGRYSGYDNGWVLSLLGVPIRSLTNPSSIFRTSSASPAGRRTIRIRTFKTRQTRFP